MSADILCQIAFLVERNSHFYLGATSDAVVHIRIVLVVQLFFFCFLFQYCLAALALAAFVLSSVVSGAASDERSQYCSSALAPEGRLAVESRSRFLFSNEMSGFYFRYVAHECRRLDPLLNLLALKLFGYPPKIMGPKGFVMLPFVLLRASRVWSIPAGSRHVTT